MTSDNRMTDRARKVLQLAEEEAVRLCHECLGTDHILVALSLEKGGVAAYVLESMGLKPEVLRQALSCSMPYRSCSSREITRPLSKSPQVRHSIAKAMEEVEAMDFMYIGTEHLLLGILHQGAAVDLLTGLETDVTEIRREVFEILGFNDPQES